MKFKPLADRVLVRPDAQPDVTLGGIIIPGTAQEKPMEGIVEASGPGRYVDGKFVANTVAVGDRVVYGKWSGNEIVVEGEKLMIMEESQILGVVAP